MQQVVGRYVDRYVGIYKWRQLCGYSGRKVCRIKICKYVERKGGRFVSQDGMYVYQQVYRYVGMHVGMHVGMCVGLCVGLCVGMLVCRQVCSMFYVVCMQMCRYECMYAGIYVDMNVDKQSVGIYVCRYVIYMHVCMCVGRQI